MNALAHIFRLLVLFGGIKLVVRSIILLNESAGPTGLNAVFLVFGVLMILAGLVTLSPRAATA